MSRWTAPSDLDYYDEFAYDRCRRIGMLACVKCGDDVSVEFDERGPVWCETCQAKDDAEKTAAARKATA